MKHLTFKEQVKIERRKNEALQAELLKNRANTDYIAMMCDIELNEEAGEEAKGDEQ